ncbi:MAG: hypothetical protein GY811_25015 [Myxococcales bacterium]|nr:hypothetical protein [Myxococcales bacterium]
MDERRKQQKPVADFGAFEEALHERVMGLERELLAEELSRAEVDAEALDRRAKRMTEDGEF